MDTCPTCGQEVLPEEPTDGSVVIDQDGDAWQRRELGDTPEGWSSVIHCSDLRGITWADLVTKYGPVTVVYRPGEGE